MIRTVADMGSCHLGKISLARKLIIEASNAGCWGVKGQLFKKEQVGKDNIVMPLEWIPELKHLANSIGINFSCSVWYPEAIDVLDFCECTFIKIAYSQRHNLDLIRKCIKGKFDEIIITGLLPVEVEFFEDKRIKSLWVYTDLNREPVYPAKRMPYWRVYKGFDGISDHTRGYMWAKYMIQNGVTLLEKHIKLEGQTIKDCPDAEFAITSKQFKEINET